MISGESSKLPYLQFLLASLRQYVELRPMSLFLLRQKVYIGLAVSVATRVTSSRIEPSPTHKPSN